MRRSLGALAALSAALVMIIGFGTSAQAYPNAPVPSVHVHDYTVVGGHDFTASATASTHCTSLSLSTLGQSGSAAGKSVSHVFHTQPVSSTKVVPLDASCSYAASGGAAGMGVMVHSQAVKAAAHVTILPRGAAAGQGGAAMDAQSTALPNTGGPTFWILVAGIVLVLGGAAALVRSRRRAGRSS